MSQQSEFEYAEQADRAEGSTSQDPREQVSETEPQSRSSSDIAAQAMGDQKIYPRQRRRQRRWLWIVIIVVIVLALLSGGYFSNSAFSRSQRLPQQTFSVSGTPNLVINDATGTVKIQRGDSNSVVIDATAHGSLFSNLSTDTVDAKQDGNIINVLVGQNGSIFNHGSVDLNITLPQNSNLQVTVNAGSLDVNGVSGQMDLKVDAGALNFENGTISGQSTFKDDAGAINFNGSIAANGNYDFEDNAGAINLTLPSSVPFTLDASSDVGKVNNDFGSNTIGDNPTSTVHVHTDVGAVNIHQQ